MAELAATMVVGPLLSIVKEKAASYLLDQYKVMEGMEEQHKILTRKLPAILDVITDAEQAVSHREGAKAWLLEVKRVAYEANEVFDEFKYEALRREAKKNGHYSKLGFDVIKLLPTHNRFAFRVKMGKKLCRIVQAIEVLVTEMNAFEFKYQQHVPASKQWRQTDHGIFDPEKVISTSRYQETKNIVDTLLGQASNADLSVIPIIGVGGQGKTTLAQLIYNESEIQKHFDLQIWVCVSDSFDVDFLAKKIAGFHPKKSKVEAPSKKGPLDILRKVLSGHRYLLVLDDVWNREPDKWDKLKASLTHGAMGSVVLTTTRDEGVAKIMGSVKTYNLSALEDNFIKEIIETRAFRFQKKEERPAALVNMVDKIVKRCRGSPLAATALGSMLCTKTSEKEWKAVSSRSNVCTDESGILPILKLSYNDLSSQMKQCFVFCAMFPKDYDIDVGKLIHLWIAHGFIQAQKEVSPEIIGKQIFNELASRSFFVDVEQARVPFTERKDGISKQICKVHDLMHDVALSVMENEYALAPEEPSQIRWLPDTARHLLLSCKEPETILNNSLEKISPAIHTLLCDSAMQDPLQHLSKFNSLKALRLPILRRSFPLKSKHLHYLRYLDLSRSHIEALPEDISILYNLQTLDVSGCSELRRLPRQMKYMTDLRHLYTHDCPSMKNMPGDLQKLVSLHTLTCFVAGTDSECSNVAELQLLNLGGHLELRELHNVTEEEAKVANIRKKELQELTLEWGTGNKDDARVLESLRPHDGLQAIKIISYRGTTFPTWMSMLRHVVEIHLSYCKKLRRLFSCGTSFSFPNLKEFTLQGLECLEGWWEKSNKDVTFPQLERLSIIGCENLTALPEAAFLGESDGTIARSAFPALKVLWLEELDSFHKWEANSRKNKKREAIEGTQIRHIIFPKLEELTIDMCDVLTALPEAPFGEANIMTPSAFPALKVLKLKYLRSFERWDAVQGSHGQDITFPQLEKLHVLSCRKMTGLPEATLLGESHGTVTRSAFPALKVLCLEDLDSFYKWEAIEGSQRGHIIFPKLEELKIESCPMLTALPEAPFDLDNCMARSAFPALKVLDLKKLKCFERWDAVEGSHGEEIMFPQLEKLSVSGCGKMTALSGQQNVCPNPATKLKSPKLSVLNMQGSEEEMFLCVATHVTSLTKLKLVNCVAAETTLEIHDRILKGALEFMDKRTHHHMELIYFNSVLTLTELCACFVQIQSLCITECTAFVHWPEKEFQSLVSLRKLEIWGCKQLVGYAQAPAAEPSTASESSSQLLPCLESLMIYRCENMVEVFKLPASLTTLQIENCGKLKSIFNRRLLQGQSELLNLQGPSPVYSEVSSSSAVVRAEHFSFPHLEHVMIKKCDSLTGVLNLPMSVKKISLHQCDELRSVESHSGEMPSLWEELYIVHCKALSSLPDGPQAYPSLKNLRIEGCPGIKRLPTCLQQHLSILGRKN